MNESFFAVTDVVVTVGPKGEILHWPAFGLFFADSNPFLGGGLVAVFFVLVFLGSVFAKLIKRIANDIRLLTSGQPVNYCWEKKGRRFGEAWDMDESELVFIFFIPMAAGFVFILFCGVMYAGTESTEKGILLCIGGPSAIIFLMFLNLMDEDDPSPGVNADAEVEWKGKWYPHKNLSSGLAAKLKASKPLSPGVICLRIYAFLLFFIVFFTFCFVAGR